MISKTVRLLPELHSELVILRDSFGHERRLTLPLVISREEEGKVKHEKFSPDEQIAREIADMAEREKIFAEHAKERGHEVAVSVDDQADGYKGCCEE